MAQLVQCVARLANPRLFVDLHQVAELGGDLHGKKDVNGHVTMGHGALRWLERGRLDPPQPVLDAIEDYRRAANPFGEWFAERVDTSDPKALTFALELHEDYKAWCEANGAGDRETMGLTAFGRALGDRQILKGPRHRSGKIRRLGAKLRPRGLSNEELWASLGDDDDDL